MSERIMKHPEESRTIQHYLVMTGDSNGHGVLFGGKLLSWIDMLAGIVAMRHSEGKVLTVAIDHLEFKKSAYVTDVVTLDGRVTWVGHSSMEIRIDTFRENKDVKKELINRAYLVMVCVDDDMNATKEVPGLLFDSDEEQAEWEAGVRRNELRKQRRRENY